MFPPNRFASLLYLAAAPCLAQDPILSSRLMHVPFTSDNARAMEFKAQVFRIFDREGKDKGIGRALSSDAWEVAEWPAYGRKQAHEFSSRMFVTGAGGQAVEFPAEGNWNETQSTTTFWLKGIDWDVNSPITEELVTLESPGGSVTFGKNKPKTLSLYDSSGREVGFAISFDPNRLHAFALTYDGKTVQVYVDGQPKLPSNTSFSLPSGVTRIVLGQRTAGGKSNKALDDLATYDRPLFLSEINRLVLEEGRRVGRKRMAVIAARTPIRIDGHLDAEEWAEAAQITGLIHVRGGVSLYNFWGPGETAADQSAFWVTYDNDYLYVAHHSPPPRRIASQENLIVAMLKNSITLHDSNVDYDDCIRISLLKPFPNGDEYKIYINGAGTTYEFYSGGSAPGSQLSGINLSWEPQLLQRSELTTRGWTIETALPWKDFYFGKPADASVLHMNLCRLWRQIIKEEHAWCYGERSYEEDTLLALPAGEVLFQGDEGVVVRLQDLGQVRRGELEIRAELINRSRADKTLQVVVSSNSGELNHNQTVKLPSGQSSPFAFSGQVVDFRTHEVAFSVSDAGNGNLYHVTTLPVIRKDRPDIYLRKFRSSERIKFEANIEFMGQHELKTITAHVQVLEKEARKTVFQKKYSGFSSYTPEFEISTAGWPLGNYEAQFTFKARGMKASRASVPYERVPLPEWWNNDIGKELGVPYPWTALKVEGETLHCWGRQYQFQKSFFPAQILTQNRPLLRAPMRLEVRTQAGDLLNTAATEASSQWPSQTDIRVQGVRTVQGKGFSLRQDLWSEYDGLVWCRLTIEPKARIVIDSMMLEIPLTLEFTDVINTYDYSLRGSGLLKPEGFVNPITPVWLGNGDGGFQWFCETDGWFFVKDTKRILRVEKRPEGATLQIVMIDVPADFESPHAIEFGFIATPARPKIRRTWQDPQFWGFRGGPGPWYPQGQEFLPAPDYWAGTKNGWKNVSAGPPVTMWMQNIYITTGGINTQTDDFKHFGDEWLRDQTERPQTFVGVTHASKSYRDWFVWRHWKSFQNNPHQSLYYDCAIEVPSTNPYAGAGYRRRDGSLAVTYPILGARDIAKRLYNMTITYYPFAWIGMHQSGMTNMAYCGFSNHFWDGENFNSIINEKQPTYRGILDPALFRAEYMGHNFGSEVMFLGQARVRPEWADREGVENVIDHLHGLCLLHDCLAVGWQIPGERERACERTYQAVQKHRLYHPAYQFVPYWHQDLVKLPSENMHASFYILRPWVIEKEKDWSFYSPQGDIPVPHKVVLIVYNNTDWEGEMRLRPDWKRLGFEQLDKVLAENAVHSTGLRIEKVKDKDGKEVEQGVLFQRPSEFARIEDGELVFPMTKWNYRMIALTRP